jgi:hypothetical protein
MKKCPKCQHIYDDDQHKCPSEEYTRQRNALVADAATAVELGVVREGDELDGGVTPSNDPSGDQS